MAEFPTYEQMAKNVAEKALDEYLIEGKTLREWIKIMAEQEPMREFTEEEAKAYSKALDKMYKPTGFNVFDEYGNYKYPSDVELTEPNTATSMPCDDVVSRQWLMRKATERFYTTNYFNHITKMIEEAPSVRPQEQTGHWIRDTITDLYHCSECRSIFHQDPKSKDNYCRYCGARMESEDR